MKKLRIIMPLAMAVVAVAVISFSVALAQENENSDSNASKLAVKVAEILGLDAAVVDDAIRQASEELKGEAIRKKLNALVENGRLTQEQADENPNWIQSRPEGIPGIGKHHWGHWTRGNWGWHSSGKGDTIEPEKVTASSLDSA